MKNFKSQIFIQTDSKKDLKLPETESINKISNIFAIHQSQTFFCVFNDGIDIYSVNPINHIKKISYINQPNQIEFIDKYLVHINNESITIHKINFFNSYLGDFKNKKLIRIYDHKLFSKTQLLGIQSNTNLQILDFNFKLILEIECSCVYSAYNLLITGFFNTLTIITGYSTIKIKLPENVIILVADEIFNNIYVACDNNKIYKISMRGNELISMEYHKLKIINIKLSICGNYLYSIDSKHICIWDTNNSVLIGFTEVECEIKNMDLIVEGDRIISNLYKNIM